MPGKSVYATDGGVDPAVIGPFKKRMKFVGNKTLALPSVHGVSVRSEAHAGIYDFGDAYSAVTIEGLGNKNWIAEWMYQKTGDASHFSGIGVDTVLMAVNDLAAHGALPIGYHDEVAAGSSEWFADEARAGVIAESFLRVLVDHRMALPQGESPALKYLVKAELPVNGAPSFSGVATGIIKPKSRFVVSRPAKPGDRIIGVPSSGIHANGLSLVITLGLNLADQFLTKLSNGRTLGEEALLPTRSYSKMVQSLLDDQVEIRKFLPATGDGVRKLLVDGNQVQYRIKKWPEVPLLFRYFRNELDVSLMDCLTTFNWGVGYYVIVPPHEVDRALIACVRAGYGDAIEVGEVEQGDRQVIFEPENITVPPLAA